MKRKILWGLLIIVVLLFTFVNVIYIYNQFIVDDGESSMVGNSLLDRQKERDLEIDKLKKDKQYTIDNPKIINNPYEISPLTSIVIFNTNDEVEIRVKVNDQEESVFPKTKEHVIPILGLKAKFDNKVVISDGDKQKELTITTDAYDSSSELVLKDNSTMIKLVSYYQKVEGYNQNMDLVWYLDGNYGGKLLKLNNGHFLIGESINGSNTYQKILEMDYLGKIYASYTLPKGYSTDMTMIDNGLFSISEDRNSIIELDLSNNEIIREIDMASTIDSNDYLISNVYYNDNSIIVNLGDKIIVLDDENLTVKKNIDTGGNISDINLINDKLAFFETGFQGEEISDCTSINGVKSKINLYNNEFNLDSSYDLPSFSYMLGSMVSDEDNIYVLLGNELYDNNLCKKQDEMKVRSRILIYNNDEIIFNGIVNDMYQYLNIINFREIKEVDTTNYEIFDNNSSVSYEEINVNEIREELDNASSSAYSYEIDSNMFTFNGIMRDDDEAYLLFVIGDKGYKYVIKEKGKNINNMIDIANLSGEANIYLVMNNYYYILAENLSL